jgi:hypothetical protein
MKFLFSVIAKIVAITAEQGAINTLYPLLSSENKETGKFYNEGIEEEPNKVVKDQEVSPNRSTILLVCKHCCWNI